MLKEDEDRYHQMVCDMAERFSQPNPNDDLKELIGKEVNKRFLGLGAVAMGIWAAANYGWLGIASAVVLGFLWVFILTVIDDFDPKHEAFRIPGQAEDLVRLEIVTEVAEADGVVWSIEEKKYERDHRKIVPVLNERWDHFWERTYNVASELEKLNPRARRKRILATAKKGSEALAQAKQMAKLNDAKLPYWASTALYAVERD